MNRPVPNGGIMDGLRHILLPLRDDLAYQRIAGYFKTNPKNWKDDTLIQNCKMKTMGNNRSRY